MKMKHSLSSLLTWFTCYKSLSVSLCLFHSCLVVSAQRKILQKSKFPAVFGFGDSIIDPGNNNEILLTVIKANFPPYGKDFEGGKPTGRFSNGLIPTDFIVDALGVKKLLPAYLDPNLKDEDFLTGVSFASGACGFDPLTPMVFGVKSMTDQLNMFRDYISKLKKIAGDQKANFIISNSMYLIVSGTDDFANTYFGTPFLRKDYDIDGYADLVRNSASSFMKKLHKLGARKIFVTNAPPLECIPSQRTLGGGMNRECAKDRQKATHSFNKKLEDEMQSLNTRFPESEFVYVDLYNIFLDLIHNSTKYGFDVVDKGCCGSGLIEVVVLCNVFSSVCEDPNKYVFWDSYHPTEKAHKLVVDEFVKRYAKYLF